MARSGIAAGRDRGHITTVRELKQRPSNMKGKLSSKYPSYIFFPFVRWRMIMMPHLYSLKFDGQRCSPSCLVNGNNSVLACWNILLLEVSTVVKRYLIATYSLYLGRGCRSEQISELDIRWALLFIEVI
ncbi:unnamed protein product [Amoebophrya sp. A120]|nr:unnamed protein product [Amoebophrya sp. A120]|eukprot:GSA120T00015320001.1